MGTKERRERERQELRQSILAAARDIAGQDGWQAVTIRRVAERVEYSPPMIYEHFASKEAMLLELIRAGFAMLLAEMRRAADSAPGAEARVLVLAQAYWAFAWEHAELYQMMHGMGGVPFCGGAGLPLAEGSLAEADAVFEYTLEALAGLAPRMASRSDLEDAVMILWATLHGLVALTMTERLDGGRDCTARLVERAVRGVLAAYLVQ